jgi:hypothetical protein
MSEGLASTRFGTEGPGPPVVDIRLGVRPWIGTMMSKRLIGVNFNFFNFFGIGYK